MDWIELGYWGMFFSAILAATILPLGSEAVFLALLYSKYDMNYLIIIAGVGNTIGGMITYYMGKLGKWSWLEKWFKIPQDKIEVQMIRAQKYGFIYALFTWLPGIGDPMAAAIGFARIHPLKALTGMFIGKTLRFLVIALMWKYSIELF
ncbi:DedA family protein [bacterium SCSIO 12643]|nr:DedA family protein [bacterium SCSIO 12643]